MKGKYKLLHEDDTHFLMQHPDGRHFAVAKKAIHAVTGHQIRKMSDGGKVKGYDDGGDVVADPTADIPNASSVETGLPVNMSSASADAPDAPAPVNPLSILQPPSDEEQDAAAQKWREGGPGRDAKEQAYKEYLEAKDSGLPMPDLQKRIDELTAEKKVAITPPAPTPKMDDSVGIPKPGPVPAATPGIDPLTDAQNQQQLAATGLALENAKEAKSNAAIQSSNVAALQKAKADTDAKTAVMNQQNDQLFKDINEQKVDPNHYWQNHNKIISSIAVVLGGLGQGLMKGGPNQALEVINKGIERDIDAQKAELGKKQNLLSKNLERTKDMQQALNMTYSQLSTVAAAQVAANSYKYGSQKAIYDGQFIVAGLKQQAMQQNYNMNVQAAKADLYGPSGIGSGERGPQGGPAQTGTGKPINPFLVANDKELAEKLVQTGRSANGTPLYSIGNDKDSAQKVKDFQTEASTIKQNIEGMKKLATVGNSMSPTQRVIFDNYVAQTAPLLLKVSGVNRFNLDEAKTHMSTLGNMNSGNIIGSTIPQLEQVDDYIDRATENIRENNIFNYRKPYKPTK